MRAIVRAPRGAVEVASRMVGAGAEAAPMAGFNAMVGAGAVGRGGGAVGAGGAGGLTGGAPGTVAPGDAGGASAALRTTRTVSFFKGTLEVCFFGAENWLSFSFIRARVYRTGGRSETDFSDPVKPQS